MPRSVPPTSAFQAAAVHGRAWDVLLFVCAVVGVVPLWVARHLPFTDLPEHVATMATLAHWFDPSWPDAHFYDLSSRGSPYLAYHLAGALLTRVTGDALLANRILLTAIGLALPYATRALIVSARGDRRLALFGCLAFWSRPLVIGFLPFMAAVPVALWIIAAAARQAEAPTYPRAAALAAATLLVFYLHLDPFLLVAAAALALCLFPRDGETLLDRLDGLPARAVWLAPATLAAIGWLWRAHADAGLQVFGDGPLTFLSREELATELPAWSFGTWRSRVAQTAGIAEWALVLGLAVHRGQPEAEGVRGLLRRLLPFGCAALLFALLPFGVGVTRMLNVRLAVFLVPTLLVALRPNPGKITDAILGAAAVLAVVVAVDAALHIHRAERGEVAGIDGLLARARPGSRLLSLEFDRSSRFAQFPPWTKVGALYRLRGGGVSSVSFAEVPHWPVRYRPSVRPPSIPGRDLEWHPCTFRNTFDGPYYDYVLVRGAIDPFRSSPGPAWRKVERLDETEGAPWTLYEREPGRVVDVGAVGANDRGPCAAD